MPNGGFFKIWSVLTALCGLAMLAGCDAPLTQNDLEGLQSRGELILITRNNAAW